MTKRFEIVPARPFEQECGFSHSLVVYHNDNQSTVIDLTDEELRMLTAVVVRKYREVRQ